MWQKIQLGGSACIEWNEYTHVVRFGSKEWVRAKPKEFAEYLAAIFPKRGIDVTPGKDTHSGWENA